MIILVIANVCSVRAGDFFLFSGMGPGAILKLEYNSASIRAEDEEGMADGSTSSHYCLGSLLGT